MRLMASLKMAASGFIIFIELEMKAWSKKSLMPIPTFLKSESQILIIIGLLLLSM